jgi:hypothetical protein
VPLLLRYPSQEETERMREKIAQTPNSRFRKRFLLSRFLGKKMVLHCTYGDTLTAAMFQDKQHFCAYIKELYDHWQKVS